MVDTPPIKRHPVFQPLSREHMGGLVQARNLIAAADSGESARERAVAEFGRAWSRELGPHFFDEERMMAGVVSEQDLRRLHAEHDKIRDIAAAVIAGPAKSQELRKLGTLLHNHIRWEERHLFAVAEQTASPEDFKTLERRAAEIETERLGSRARRRL